jgi:hypothetical protein
MHLEVGKYKGIDLPSASSTVRVVHRLHSFSFLYNQRSLPDRSAEWSLSRRGLIMQFGCGIKSLLLLFLFFLSFFHGISHSFALLFHPFPSSHSMISSSPSYFPTDMIESHFLSEPVWDMIHVALFCNINDHDPHVQEHTRPATPANEVEAETIQSPTYPSFSSSSTSSSPCPSPSPSLLPLRLFKPAILSCNLDTAKGSGTFRTGSTFQCHPIGISPFRGRQYVAMDRIESLPSV